MDPLNMPKPKPDTLRPDSSADCLDMQPTPPDGPCFLCEGGNNPEHDGECWMHTVNGESWHCGGCLRDPNCGA